MVFDGDAVYFTSDNGLYKIDLPIIVAEWCWDGGDVCYYDEDEGEAEDEEEDYMPLITYAGPADAGGTSGLVCGALAFEEAQPSYAPTPEAGLPLEPFDCTVNFHPVQVMKTDDEDYYSVMQLDPSTGEYEEVYDLKHLITEDGHVNAVDLWLDGDKYYVAGSVRNDDDEASKLCFFDSEDKVCLDEDLEEVKANAGCILGDNFY